MAAATVAMGEGVREAVWRPSILYRANVYTHTHEPKKRNCAYTQTKTRTSGRAVYRCTDVMMQHWAVVTSGRVNNGEEAGRSKDSVGTRQQVVLFSFKSFTTFHRICHSYFSSFYNSLLSSSRPCAIPMTSFSSSSPPPPPPLGKERIICIITSTGGEVATNV